MAHRHKVHRRAKGGEVVYAGKGSNVVHEAEEKKHGGGTHLGKHHGHKGKHRIHKRRGGSAGSDKAPFSSAGSGMHVGPVAAHHGGHGHHHKHGGHVRHHGHHGHHRG